MKNCVYVYTWVYAGGKDQVQALSSGYLGVLEGKGTIKRQIKAIDLSWYYFACYSEHEFHDFKK